MATERTLVVVAAACGHVDERNVGRRDQPERFFEPETKDQLFRGETEHAAGGPFQLTQCHVGRGREVCDIEALGITASRHLDRVREPSMRTGAIDCGP